VSILPNQSNGAIVKNRHNHCAAGMVHDFPGVSYISLANRIHGDIEYATAENFRTVQDPWLLWCDH
jgi:hypothetical protein